jgi:hypothetical protein
LTSRATAAVLRRVERQRERKREQYRTMTPERRARKREQDLQYWREQAGWFEPGGMATDDDMRRLREFIL